MHTRQNVLNQWLETLFVESSYSLTPLDGDASFRKYFRVVQDNISWIVMDAPPDKEPIHSFVELAKLLAHHGITTPNIQAVDLQQGFILLEDFGDQLLLPVLAEETVDDLYSKAISILIKMQQCSTANLPCFDEQHMQQELALFPQWFLKGYLELTLDASEEKILEQTFHWLTHNIASEPQVFIHRDYHSRNLMLLKTQDLGVIDFQDAMKGPLTYDLVSLLKDCYIQWPRMKVLSWLAQFHQQLPSSMCLSFKELIQAFDLCGLQRHLKVLGIFCRLHLRDEKSGYLRDLPRVFQHMQDVLCLYPELTSFKHFIEERVQPIFLKKCTL